MLKSKYFKYLRALPAVLIASAGLANAEQLKMVAGSVGGGYFKAAAALSEYVAAEMPDVKITVGPGTTWSSLTNLTPVKSILQLLRMLFHL